MHRRQLLAGMTAIAAAQALPVRADEAAWPVKRVQILVPASPGGITDSSARTFARALERAAGVTVSVVNQTGGGGVVALQSVASARPDGSTLLIFHAMLHAAHLFGRSPFTYEDFTPISTLSQANDVYVARADAPFSTLPELFEHARTHPGEVMLASQMGGTTQVKGDALVKASGGTLKVVDAGPEAERLAALIGEQVQVSSMSVATAQQYVESGDIKVLAVPTAKPDPFAPDWPTAQSQGVDIDFPLTLELYGPPGIAEGPMSKIAATMQAIAADPKFAEEMNRIRQTPYILSPDETADFVAKEFSFVDSMIN
ncbi:tripartite tricarboxylate transporter substrate binding protein [Poseidonocella sp. HB161398]|uniref:Bug family tripartite tricarboxylate transporter substrate binding protein n=1 Tax=Poseidonocella sp. HB161398 TaxID=2320855 RepID=UPI001109467A|nr:tripartite tricarboxylate transporter substrate binding protein [Poseidonocella sp. HB161398]